MERSSRVLYHEKPKNLIVRKNAQLSVSAVMFCKQFLAYAVHIDWCYHSIHKHSSRFQHIIYVNFMHLYDDIGDASSSLCLSTSS